MTEQTQSKVVQIDEDFSCTPGAEFEFEGERICAVKKGTLYVMAEGATGIAKGAGSKAVAMIDGAKVVQGHEKADVLGITPKSKVEFMKTTAKTTKRGDRGTSTSVGAGDPGILDTLREDKSRRLR